MLSLKEGTMYTITALSTKMHFKLKLETKNFTAFQTTTQQAKLPELNLSKYKDDIAQTTLCCPNIIGVTASKAFLCNGTKNAKQCNSTLVT